MSNEDKIETIEDLGLQFQSVEEKIEYDRRDTGIRANVQEISQMHANNNAVAAFMGTIENKKGKEASAPRK